MVKYLEIFTAPSTTDEMLREISLRSCSDVRLIIWRSDSDDQSSKHLHWSRIHGWAIALLNIADCYIWSLFPGLTLDIGNFLSEEVIKQSEVVENLEIFDTWVPI